MIPIELKEKLLSEAQETHLTTSTIIRQAIILYLQK